MRAIVVDDSRVSRGLIKRVLSSLGIECIEAGDGLEALTVLREVEPPDLAMLDWNMPNMNGYDLVKALRAERRYDAMRVIMCTSETETDQMHKALMAGADEYIMKPFTAEGVMSKLEMLGLTPGSSEAAGA
jgi:two-component system chemotaxis response regulator CheY